MKNMSRAKKFQFWIDQIKAYQKMAPEFLNQNLRSSDSEFTIDYYFDILKNLGLEKGWLVDCLYFRDRLGGEPLIIAYPKIKSKEYQEIIDKIYNTSLEQATAGSNSEDIAEQFFNKEDVDNYLVHVRLDGSEEAYFQFVILAELGSQFSLFWHALYNDQEFVCTSKRAYKIINRINRSKEEMSFFLDDLLDERLDNIDFEPQISIKADKVVVRLVFFTKWGGFIEAKYGVKKDFPHKIIERETETLIEYDCGYLY